MKTSKTSPFNREHQVLAALLKDMRGVAGLTQEQLAESLKWRQTDVSKVERCARLMGHVELRHWVAALNTDMIALELEFQDRLQRLGIAAPSPKGGLRLKRQKLR
ncbi:XRE family transcriptional regulator [Variovorax sp. J22R24]|uniref:helix-turn-helix domain-containing protein n=1 Tax=Variovorax gracilis TaxID=3053502 RepID=UPI00257689EC|nr:helix-turn-helix domain-containing protein [Variovorax sp. J22R24]MDM0104859.1 XRE family transcriptional regulator [Variovorax sp. J22R24]